MEFCEKILELRKQKNLTQAELAEKLYVSRTAISKWESGRGCPSIESLRAISQFFGVSLDELLSPTAMLSIAEQEAKGRARRTRELVFGLLDCSACLFFFLPLFAQSAGGAMQAVSLLQLNGVQLYSKILYGGMAGSLAVWGILLLALQNCKGHFWLLCRQKGSLLLGILAALLFMLGRQPYAAVFAFLLLLIKFLLIYRD